MGNLVDIMAMILVLCARQEPLTFAHPCSPTNTSNTSSGSNNQGSHKNCHGPVIHGDDGTTTDREDDSSDTDTLANHAVYTCIVVVGVILIPVIVFARVFWLRKLNRQRNNTINEVRRIVDQRSQEEAQRRNDIFSIALVNVPFEDIYGKLPSYEECLTSPSTGCPPSYDQPPCYSQKQPGENSQEQ